jgi:glutathionyl-hydroquinone reductase
MERGMGMLVEGKWQRRNEVWGDSNGRFRRTETQFRNWVTADGRPGPSGQGGFAAAAGRYHLYVSLACPWAHRTLIMRALKGLDDMVSLSVVHWLMGDDGWSFEPGEGVIGDPVMGAEHLHEIYAAAKPDYSGRVTVPVLWDKSQATIVNNESAEIIRMFNSAFDELGAAPGDYFPDGLRDEIEAVNARVYDTVNNGVYKSGFATTQEAYEEAVGPLFETLDWLEKRLARQPYVAGDRLSEADIRLFTTLARFDPVYNGHFKCNIRRLVDYPRLWALTRRIYQIPEVRPTVNFTHIKRHYYMSHRSVNPTGIVPLGPELDFDAPV